MQQYMENIARSIVTVGSTLGLHARPAAQLVHLAGKFQSDVKIIRTDGKGEADGRSVLSILMLAAAKDTELELRASGVDAENAVSALSDYFLRNFDEN